MNWNLIAKYFVNAVFELKLKLFMLLAIIVALIGIYLLTEKPSYKTSWIMLLPGTERATTINLENMGEARTAGNNAYSSVSISPKNTYKEIALSEAVIAAAAETFGVKTAAFSKPRIKLIDQTPAMQFTLKGRSKSGLIKRAKLYNKTFHDTLDQLRENEIERHFNGVENNLAEAKKRLKLARNAIVDFQSNSEVVSDDQFKRWMTDAEQLRNEKTKAIIATSQADAKIKSMLYQFGIDHEQANALLRIRSNPYVGNLIDALSTQMTTQTTIGEVFGPNNPERKILDQEVKSLKKELTTLLTNKPSLLTLSETHLYGLLSDTNRESLQALTSLIAERDGLNAQRGAIDLSWKAYQSRISNHTRSAATLADLQRDHQIAEAIFTSALAKLDTGRLDIYATYPLTQLLTQPGVSIVKDRLKSKLVIVAAIMVYGLLAFALTLKLVRKQLVLELKEPLTHSGTSHA